MATRSTIALEYADGTVKQVYCHWDGYLEHNGQLLMDYWSDPAKLDQLIQLGNLSCLGSIIGEKHPFSNPHKYGTQEFIDWQVKHKAWCLFYGRDREENKFEANEFSSIKDYCKRLRHEDYNYILRKDGKWYVEFYGEYNGPLNEAFDYKKIQEEQ